MREQPNDSVGHTTDRRPAWNKCRLKHGLECRLTLTYRTADRGLTYSLPPTVSNTQLLALWWYCRHCNDTNYTILNKARTFPSYFQFLAGVAE